MSIKKIHKRKKTDILDIHASIIRNRYLEDLDECHYQQIEEEEGISRADVDRIRDMWMKGLWKSEIAEITQLALLDHKNLVFEMLGCVSKIKRPVITMEKPCQ